VPSDLLCVWKCIEKPEEPKPEPPKPPTGGIWKDDDSDHLEPSKLNCDNAKRVKLENDQASMSSIWKDGRVTISPHDVFKSLTWNGIK
jgi:hypothetical protein